MSDQENPYTSDFDVTLPSIKKAAVPLYQLLRKTAEKMGDKLVTFKAYVEEDEANKAVRFGIVRETNVSGPNAGLAARIARNAFLNSVASVTFFTNGDIIVRSPEKGKEGRLRFIDDKMTFKGAWGMGNPYLPEIRNAMPKAERRILSALKQAELLSAPEKASSPVCVRPLQVVQPSDRRNQMANPAPRG